MTMKEFTAKTQKKLAEFTLDLLSLFYLNRYSEGFYIRPFKIIHIYSGNLYSIYIYIYIYFFIAYGFGEKY
jgi:hypothetical protein